MAPRGPQETHFEQFGDLAAKWPQEPPRRLILSMLVPRLPNGPKRSPGGSFWAQWYLGHQMAQVGRIFVILEVGRISKRKSEEVGRISMILEVGRISKRIYKEVGRIFMILEVGRISKRRHYIHPDA